MDGGKEGSDSSAVECVHEYGFVINSHIGAERTPDVEVTLI